ncbi:MAG: glutathione synthase [Ruminococcus sp.]
MSFNFDNQNIIKNMYKGSFGIEKESLRVTKDGYLSHTPHPFARDRHIDRDFCENQIEIVTDVFDTTSSAINQLSELHNAVIKKLRTLETGEEILWLFSNPPYVKGENDIPIASFKGNLKGKELYRKYLSDKYGKKKMLFSGIHFNFSFADRLLEQGFLESGKESFADYKNSLYLELSKKMTKYSWLIVYLTAASPIMDGSFFDDIAIGNDLVTPFSSARCSEIGYWNEFTPILNYNNLKGYVDSIQQYIDEGLLKSASELYYPVRLKPPGANSIQLLEKIGINHIELRVLDLNPLSPVGIFKEDMDFIHMLILYLTSLDDVDFSESEQVSAVKNVKQAAKYDDENTFIDFGGEKIPVKAAALNVLCNMQKFFEKYNQGKALNIIDYQKSKIIDKSKRYVEIIRKNYSKNYVEKGISLSLKYAEGSD